MNRDEKRDRLAGLAPAVVELQSHRALFPRESIGGTWISANDSGLCLALINWHRIEQQAPASLIAAPTRRGGAGHFATENDQSQARSTPTATEAFVSRGLVVKELAGKCTAREIAASVKELPVRKMRPFRLIAILPREKCVIEWRWNLRRLATRNHEWQRRHWFSSGFDEHRAERVREKVCAYVVAAGDDPGKGEAFRRRRVAGVNSASYSLSWLRDLHRSHTPKRGPFSICMHRADAATVSYTEVLVTRTSASMRYTDGPPCTARFTVTKELPIA